MPGMHSCCPLKIHLFGPGTLSAAYSASPFSGDVLGPGGEPVPVPHSGQEAVGQRRLAAGTKSSACGRKKGRSRTRGGKRRRAKWGMKKTRG